MTLLDLAQKIETLGREHPRWPQAHEPVLVLCGYLRAMHFISEVHERDAQQAKEKRDDAS